MLKVEIDAETFNTILSLYMEHYYKCLQNNEDPIKFGDYAMNYLKQQEHLKKLKNIDKDRLN